MSVAVFDFGLTEEQFWRLTPAKFYMLSERLDEQRFVDDVRVGQLCALVANMFREKGQPPYKATDFVPGAESEPEQQSPAHMQQMFEGLIVPTLNQRLH